MIFLEIRLTHFGQHVCVVTDVSHIVEVAGQPNSGADDGHFQSLQLS